MKKNILFSGIAYAAVLALMVSCKEEASLVTDANAVDATNTQNVVKTLASQLVIDENFNQHTGAYNDYTLAMLTNDFNGVNSRAAGVIRGFDGNGNTWPQDNAVGNGVLRADYLANAAGGPQSGFLFDKTFADCEEAEMEYKVYFEGAGSNNQFVWAAGGKLPGLGGSNSSSVAAIPVGCTENLTSINNGFSARLMWRTKPGSGNQGQLVVYTYFPDRDISKCGVDIPFMDVQPNTWYTVKQYIKLNTPGTKNGVLKMWVNGSLKLTRTNVLYRISGKSSVKINSAIFHTYRGGKPTDERFWSPNRDHIRFDDFKVRRIY